MANTDNAFSFRFVRSGNGDTSPPIEAKTASVAVKYGDPVVLAADGELDLVATGGDVLGFAMHAASTDGTLHYAVARNGDVWKAQLATGAVATTTLVGDRMGVSGATAGVLEITANATGAFAVDGLADEPNNSWSASLAVLNVKIVGAQYSAV